jgi:Cu(I)/Ag(I) efflux system membrane protein CusA/SilA
VTSVVSRVVAWSGRHPWTVIALSLLGVLAGELSRRAGPADVLPELSDPRLSVVVEWMGHPASDVSARLTEPLLRAVSEVGGVGTVRGTSMTGMSYLDVVLRPDADERDVRQGVAERLDGMRGSLPAGARYQIGPVASSTGWVFQYALFDPTHAESRRSLRHLQDTMLRPALATLGGVAEVATVGGETEEVVIDVGSERLRARGMSLGEVRAAVQAALAGGTEASLATLRELPVGRDGSAPRGGGPPGRPRHGHRAGGGRGAVPRGGRHRRGGPRRERAAAARRRCTGPSPSCGRGCRPA